MSKDFPRPPLGILVDSCVYREEPDRRSIGFRLLERLAATRKVQLHVPYFVEQEIKEYQLDAYRQNLNRLQKALSDLRRKRMPEAAQEELNVLLRAVGKLRTAIDDYSKHELSIWWDNLKAMRHPVADDHGQRVAERYFRGLPPFREPKARNDFPDGFIFECLLDVYGKSHNCCLVSSDKGLRQAARDEGVPAYATIEDFIQEELDEDEIYEELESEQAGEASRLLKSIDASLVSETEEMLFVSLIGDTMPISDLPLDLREAEIADVIDSDEKPKLALEDAEYIGAGIFVIPFTWQTLMRIKFEIPRSRLAELSADQFEEIDMSEHTETTLMADSLGYMQVVGSLTFDVDDRLGLKHYTEQELTELLKNGVIDVADINLSAS